MKARIPITLSSQERKALEEEVKKQCVETTEQYELDIDTAWVYAIRKRLNIGSKRMAEIYGDMFELRAQMQDFYKAERNDNIAEFAMRYELKNAGIDVEKMYADNKKNHRFKVVVK